MADGAIKAIEEPVTEASYRADFADFYLARNGGENGSTLDLVRNECRMQMTPELQQNLAQATVTIPGFGFARFLGMTRGREAEWLGDREQTYRYELLPDEMGELWKPGLPNGWVVPELPPTKRGRKRQRRANRRGFMLVRPLCLPRTQPRALLAPAARRRRAAPPHRMDVSLIVIRMLCVAARR